MEQKVQWDRLPPHTFTLRRRVIIPTASADSRTGDPMPISFPVSRGSSCDEDAVEVAPSNLWTLNMLYRSQPGGQVRLAARDRPMVKCQYHPFSGIISVVGNRVVEVLEMHAGSGELAGYS
jgi:hypothetical protein